MEKVLVTGATGYIGLHCIQQLLEQGYSVNGSVRSPERKEEIFNALKKHGTSTDELSLFTFNLNEDDGWDDGMQGCDYLLHVASPIALQRHSEEFFVKPAVAGVKRALKFAKKHLLRKQNLERSGNTQSQLFDHAFWLQLQAAQKEHQQPQLQRHLLAQLSHYQ